MTGPLDTGGLLLRQLERKDLDAVVTIETGSFPSPWTREMFEAELDGNPFSRQTVAVLPGRAEIVGYVVFWLMFEEVHLLNLAVHGSFRRGGIGRMLLNAALEPAHRQGGRRAFLEVRESNEPARRFYERAGFLVESVRRNYYEHPKEDALILVKRLEDASGV